MSEYNVGQRAGYILADILNERIKQNWKWGVQRHNWAYWCAILGEEMGEVSKEVVEMETDLSKLRTELIHLSAVAVAIVEHIDEVAR